MQQHHFQHQPINMKKNKSPEQNNIDSTSNIQEQEIVEEIQQSYLDYAMSVIVSRALPDVRDGLKPVQRRILWAMWDTGLTHQAKFKKSANIVGEVLGKYHPHGESAVYDALARMAQDFSLRYPLIDGQGNWGSIDGDSQAAMRYTEARLSKIAQELLIDIDKETINWIPNYDNTKKEPEVLPAKLPNILLNGSMGIAVGMATNIPPHNLQEIADAIIYLCNHPEADTEELMQFVKGPDFPTGGIIYDKNSIMQAYKTGRGSITTRGVAEIQEKKNGYEIIITEIPYQVNKAEMISHIAELVQDKKIQGIKDIRDESDREGLRIVIELKNDSSPQKILNQLYEYTDLQKNFPVNMVALVNGLQPQTLSLKNVLQYHIDHRKEVIKKRTEFDLKKAQERAHILQGLVKALNAIDKIIATIKKSKDRVDAHKNLVKNFDLTPIQADAILEMRLQSLAALEKQKIETELEEKRKLIKDLMLILKNPKKIIEIIQNDLEELKKNYSDPRRTKIITTGIKEFKEEDLIPEEETIIILTKDGYIKRTSPDEFRIQNRGGKGLIGLDLKDQDVVIKFIAANTHDNILLFTNQGRVFQKRVFEIPAANRTSKGKSIHNFIELSQSENIVTIISYNQKDSGFLTIITKNGIIKKIKLENTKNIRKNGLIILKLKNDDVVKQAQLTSGHDIILITTALGNAIMFKENELRPMSRIAAGVKALKLKNNDQVSGMDIINTEIQKNSRNPKILTITAKGFAKQTPLKEYHIQKRGGSGIKTAKITDKTGPIIDSKIVDDTFEQIIVFSAKGQVLKTELKTIRIANRTTQGVKIMNINSDDKIIGFICL
ncbi:MAG: DNA gyrase subunit A [Minisyncoccia bacterium]